jgi:hypothetical protein
VRDYGIRAVIAEGFGDIFRMNSYQNGVLPVVLPHSAVQALCEQLRAQPGATVTVDLENQWVTGPDGAQYAFDIDASVKKRLLAGLDDIGVTMQHQQAIDAFEERLANEMPWIGRPRAWGCAQSIAQLVAIAKAKPGRLSFASTGNGSAPGTLAFAQGETDMMFSNVVAATPIVKAKRLRALGIASLKRSALLSALPALNESGLPGSDVAQFYSLLAPAGTGATIVRTLNAVIAAQMQTADLRSRLAADGSEVASSTPEELEALIVREIARWDEVIRTAGIRAEWCADGSGTSLWSTCNDH